MTVLDGISRRRWRLATALTFLMVFIYFGFIFLVAFQKEWMGSLVFSGMSIGIVLGALVIVFAWILTLVYVRWANTHLDTQMDNLKKQEQAAKL